MSIGVYGLGGSGYQVDLTFVPHVDTHKLEVRSRRVRVHQCHRSVAPVLSVGKSMIVLLRLDVMTGVGTGSVSISVGRPFFEVLPGWMSRIKSVSLMSDSGLINNVG